jgi:hypothetical protein
MTACTDESLLVLPSRSGSRLIRVMARSKGVWAIVGIVVIASALLPTVAKAPVALLLAGVLMAPVVRGLRDPATATAVESLRWRDPTQAVRFDGGVRREDSRGRWRQVRCVVRGTELMIGSYWRRSRAPQVVSIKSSSVTSVTTSELRDGLKPGLMSVIHLRLANGSTLQLAVDRELAEAVSGTLTAHA